MKRFLMTAIWIGLGCACALAAQIATNGTVVATTNAPAKTDRPRQLYEDQEFRVVAVNYGNQASPQTPGFYVLRKKMRNWVRIEKVSLTGAILGRSPTFEECRAAGTSPCSIGWDFSTLAQQDYVDFPLKCGGFLFFPDKIERNEENGLLILRFNSRWKMAPVETVLSLSLADLRRVTEQK